MSTPSKAEQKKKFLLLFAISMMLFTAGYSVLVMWITSGVGLTNPDSKLDAVMGWTLIVPFLSWLAAYNLKDVLE